MTGRSEGASKRSEGLHWCYAATHMQPAMQGQAGSQNSICEFMHGLLVQEMVNVDFENASVNGNRSVM